MGCGQWEACATAGALPWKAGNYSHGSGHHWAPTDDWLPWRGDKGMALNSRNCYSGILPAKMHGSY